MSKRVSTTEVMTRLKELAADLARLSERVEALERGRQPLVLTGRTLPRSSSDQRQGRSGGE
jgi:hypothetical protein